MTLSPEFQKIKEGFAKQYGPQGDARFTQWIQQNRYNPTQPIAKQEAEKDDTIIDINNVVDTLYCQMHGKPIRAHKEDEIVWDLYLINLLIDVLDNDIIKDVFTTQEVPEPDEGEVEDLAIDETAIEPEVPETERKTKTFDVSSIVPPNSKPKSKRKTKPSEDEDEDEAEDEDEDEDEIEDLDFEKNSGDKPLEKIASKSLYKDLSFIASALYTNGLYYLPMGGVPAYNSFGPTPVPPDKDPLADVKSVLSDTASGLETEVDWYLKTIAALQEINKNFEEFLISSHFNNPKAVELWKEAHKTLRAWHEVVSAVTDEINEKLSSRFKAVIQLHLGPTVGYDATPDGTPANPSDFGWKAPEWQVVEKDALLNMLKDKTNFFVRAYQPAEYNVTIRYFKDNQPAGEETKRMSYNDIKELAHLIETKSGKYADAVIADAKPLPDSKLWLVNYSIRAERERKDKRNIRERLQRQLRRQQQQQPQTQPQQPQSQSQSQLQPPIPATPTSIVPVEPTTIQPQSQPQSDVSMYGEETYDAKYEETIKYCHKTPPKGYPKNRNQYADPECYKYPLDTEKHVRAALAYFSKPENYRQYSKSKRAKMWSRIKKAAKRYNIEISDLGKFKAAIEEQLALINGDCLTCDEIANFVAAKYPWNQCIRDQRNRYGSLKIARKVCGYIRHRYGHLEEGGKQLYECKCGEVGDEDKISKHIYEDHLHLEEQYNPWAICRAMQKKHGWSDEKTERCIKKVKAKVGWKEEEEDYEDEETNESAVESPYHKRQPCPWCDKIFDSWAELAEHMNKLHKHEEGAKDIISDIMSMAEDLEQGNKIYKMFPHI